MIDRNYVYQGIGLLIPFFLSPVIYEGYGAAVFGQFSLLVTWGTFISYAVTLRSEVLITSSANENQAIEFFSSSFFIWIFLSGIVVLFSIIGWVFYDLIQPLEAGVLAITLSFFSMVNYYLIIVDKFAYTITQLVKISIFYAFLLSFLYALSWASKEALLLSFLISISIATIFAIKVFCVSKKRFFWVGKGVVINSGKRGVPFMLSSLLGSSREMLMASFIMYYFGSEIVGLYYFSVLYMTKAFIAYSTIQSNKIKHSFFNSLDLIPVFKRIAYLGIPLSIMASLSLYIINQLGFFLEFDFGLMFALLPVTFIYLILMPFTALYETLELGRVNLYFNVLIVVALGFVSIVTVIFGLSIFYYVLLSSVLWFFIVVGQVFYGLNMLNKTTQTN